MSNSDTGVVYSSEHGLQLDLHRSGERDAPLVVYMHGGGFARGDREDLAETRLRALAAAGLTVASIDYRLSPAARFPDPVDDVKSAVEFLRQNAGGLGVPADRIGLIGASAGGYLATMAGITATSSQSVQAVSSWFAPSDFVTGVLRSPLEAQISPVTYELSLLGAVDDDDLLRRASPAHLDLASAPPFLLLHGDRDRIVAPWHSQTLHDALVAAGGRSSQLIIGGAGHEDPAFDGGHVIAMVAAWMKSILR